LNERYDFYGAVLTGPNETGDVPFVLVEDEASLDSLADRLAGERGIGVDVEADSMFHYDEKVCLLQLSTAEGNFIVDPLRIPELTSLEKVFHDPGVEKVFHGADFDVRSLRRDFSFQIQGLFDTQIAARFLGKGDLGLASLVKDYFGVNLEKKYRKRDWSARPLPMEMLLYGVLDSFYLLELSEALKRELKEKERLDWVLEECEILSRVASSDNPGGPLFIRFKGAGRLDPRSLAVLEAILRFRDKMAARRDVPHFKVIGNEAVRELVLARPTCIEDLKGAGILSPKQVQGLGGAVVKEISIALALSDKDLPSYPARHRAGRAPRSTERYNALKNWRDRRAIDLGLDSSVLCPNTVLKTVAGSPPDGPEALEGISGIRRWQVRLFGEEMCDVIRRCCTKSVRPARRTRRGAGRA
jgi:ribonuclease D